MPHLRVTALGLAGVLLIAAPASLDPTSAGASAPAPDGDGSARSVAVEPAAQVAQAAQRTDRERPARVRSELLPATDLTRPARGETAVRRLGDDLPDVARANGLTAARLRTTLRTDSTVWVAPSGRLLVKEQLHAGGTFSGAEVAQPAAPLGETFELHSKPGSQHTVLLDFDGVDVVAASSWSGEGGIAAGAYEGWDPMGDGPGFSDAERAAIQDIWARVAEDFAPFDIDVTTADPGDAALRHDGPGDTAFGTRLVVTDDTAAPQTLCGSQCGGVAWIGQVDRPSSIAEPAWVFAELNAQSPKAIAEAASHEVGHTLWLYHDGVDHGDGTYDEYYSGHGTWAPIMGNASGAPVSQWSRGFYPGANNNQDDVAVIGRITGFRTDEGGDGWVSPLRTTGATAYITGEGDGDVYLVDDCTPGARAAAVTAGSAADLDVELTLARPSGNSGAVVTQVNPLVSRVDALDQQPWYGEGVAYLSSAAVGLDADVDVPEGGPWLLQVRGGEGRTSEDGSTDYSTDGSLGAYRLVVEGCSTPDVVPARPTGLALTTSGTDLVATWAAPVDSGGLPLTGYRITLNGASPTDVAADVTTYTFAGAADRNATVEVRAVNAIGAGAPASATSNPTTVPSQVTDVTIVTDGVTCDFGPRGIQVAWSSPASNGGSPTTGYELWQRDGDEWFRLFEFGSTGRVERRGTCFNPVAGEVTDYRLVALNSSGAGEPYDFTALLKGQPTRITPTITTDRDARTVTVDWQTPFDGGEPIERLLLTLTTGNYLDPVAVVLPPGTTTYTFTGVRTGPKQVRLAAANVWGPASLDSSSRATSETSFTMPPISPDPGPVDAGTIRFSVTDKGTGSMRVSWDPVVPADPVHDPILWYDVCVDVIGEIHLPGGAGFGDGTTRGTDLCYDRTTIALTADATSDPHIDLTGLSVGEHFVTITPVNPGGPAFMPAMRLVSFAETAITCPTDPYFQAGQMTLMWQPLEVQVISWTLRARHQVDGTWTDWAPGAVQAGTFGIMGYPVTPGRWEFEVTARVNIGGLVDGPPVVCAVTVPEEPVYPPTDPTPDPTPEPTPEPSPDPDAPETPPTVPPVAPPVPTTGSDPAPAPVPASAPAAPAAPAAKPGRKGGTTTVRLAWSAPRSAGSSPVTAYEVVVYKLKKGKPVVVSRTSVRASKRATELRLRKGSYRFAVRARNAVGWSPVSALSKAVSPR